MYRFSNGLYKYCDEWGCTSLMVSYYHMPSLLVHSPLFLWSLALSWGYVRQGQRPSPAHWIKSSPRKVYIRTRCDWRKLTADLSTHILAVNCKSQFKRYVCFYLMIIRKVCWCCSAGNLAVTHSLREVHVSDASCIFQECNQYIMLLLY